MEATTLKGGDQLSRIRELNDKLRTSGRGGTIVVTTGIAALDPGVARSVYQAVENFAEFTEDNDPHGEHDCAALKVGALRIIWKIDYYDRHRSSHSPDPASAKETRRVLTIMLAEEY